MIISSLIATIVPIVLLVFPGVLFMRSQKSIWHWAADSTLWSIGIWILSFYAAAYVQTPSLIVFLGVSLASIALRLLYNTQAIPYAVLRRMLPLTLLCVFLYGLLGGLALYFHDGLPSGDSEKAIIWGSSIAQTYALPSYETAITRLNRDPVDFATPGLHGIVGFLLSFGSYSSLVTISFLALAVAIATSVIGASITTLLTNIRYAPFVTFTFILTHLRFLRYIREPGYHLQNVFGELLLFGLLYIGLQLLYQWQWNRVFLGLLIAIALGLSHQFSAFLAVFVLIPFVVALAIKKGARIQAAIAQKPIWAVGIGSILLVALVLIMHLLQVSTKVFHIFTTNSHLIDFLPSALDYVRILGIVTLPAGVAGMAALWLVSKKRNTLSRRLFSVSCIILFVLSQGPLFGIDIPPVRALLYLVIPLCIASSYCFVLLASHIRRSLSPAPFSMAVMLILVCLPFGIPMITSVHAAYTLSHDIPTNSTLTPELIFLKNRLDNDSSSAVLVDDSNKRASSWLSLGNQPTFVRLTDLERQMEESIQSPLRQTLFLRQLDFEKIYDLGSFAFIDTLLKRHSIQWILGVDKTSAVSFIHNPLLRPKMTTGTMTLFGIQNTSTISPFDSARTDWLLRPTTLTNDIGDAEDTFEHLPASLRTTRLTAPRVQPQGTYRTTNSEYISVTFNAATYAKVLWETTDVTEYTFFLHTMTPVRDLTVMTSTGATIPIPASGVVSIPTSDLSYTDKGFVTVVIHNPRNLLIDIDLVAFGPS